MDTNDTTSHPTLSPAENALALSHTYTLFSQLYLHGLTPESRDWVQGIAELSEVLASHPETDREAAAIHQALLGLNIFPYESVFLDDTGMFGGQLTDQVVYAYSQLGYRPDPASTSPDQLGEELGLLAFLCGAEADALEDNLPAIAQRLRHAQLDFMRNHLLRWLFPCLQAIGTQDQPFYTALAELTADFVHAHYGTLTAATNLSAVPYKLPEPPPLLDDDQTELKDIADYLMMPAYAGLFLSRNAIGQIGRSQRLPRGFGNRAQMLVNMMRSAIQYEGLPDLVDQLSQLCQRWDDAYQNYQETMPEFVPFIHPWRERIQQTIQILTQIQSLTLDHEI